MLIAQISDTHIAQPGQKTYGIAPMVRNLERAIDHINQLTPRPDLVLVTGDITNDGLLEETQQAAKLLRKLNCPFYITPGNHDDRMHLRSVFGDSSCPSQIGEFINYVIEGHEIRLICLDSTKPGHSGGEFCQSRAEWLEDTLSQQPEQPTLIFMHHPPLKLGILETDKDGFQGAELLGNLIKKHDNIEQIMCGHTHLAFQSRWRGTLVNTAPSMGMQLVFDLTLKQPSRFVLDAPAYQLHHWTAGHNLVTQTIHVRETRPADGPFLFEHHQQNAQHQDAQHVA